MWAWGAIGGVVAVILVIIVCCCCCCCCKNKSKIKEKLGKRMPKQRVDLKAFRREMMESTAQLVQPSAQSLAVTKSSTLPRVSPSRAAARRFSQLSISPASTPHRSLSKQHSLDLQMYSDDGSSSVDGRTESSEGCPEGKIRFRLEYDFQTSNLMVTVVECKELAAKDFGGSSDPYVKVYVLPNKRLKYQTKVHKKTLNPRFNETFVFHDMEFRSIRDRSVYFEVIDFDQFSKHDMIGVLDIPLEDIDLGKTTEMWQDLKPPGKSVRIRLNLSLEIVFHIFTLSGIYTFRGDPVCTVLPSNCWPTDSCNHEGKKPERNGYNRKIRFVW